MEYVVVVVPSCATTCTSIVLSPTLSPIGSLASPDATLAYEPPFERTATVAVESSSVGVTVMVETALPTASLYDVVPVANVGASVPALTVSPLRLESVDRSCRVTVIVYVVVELASPVPLTSIGLSPTLSESAPLDWPEAALAYEPPLTRTCTCANESSTVGATVTAGVP